MICSECGKEKDTGSFNPECSSPTVCFRCRVSSVQIGFGGYQDQFHEGTNAERQRTAIKEAKDNGHDPVPAWTNTYTGSTAGSHKKLADTVKNTKVF